MTFLALLPLLASVPAHASCEVKVAVDNQLAQDARAVTNVETMADSWYKEHLDGGYSVESGSVSNLGCSELGHYTQVVWSETRYIGCGFELADKNDHNYSYNYYYLVCNYVDPHSTAQVSYESTYDKKSNTVTLTVKPKSKTAAPKK